MSFVVIALIRLVPYVLAALYAHKKGYKWLVRFCLYLCAVAVYGVVATPSPALRSIFSSIGAVMILMHALDLNPRIKK